MVQVFLSHNTADKPAVETVARYLQSQGLEPWLDTWNLLPGDHWQQGIEDALRGCQACAVFIGPSGMGPWQHQEMEVALDRRVSQGGLRVVPVLLPGAQRGKESGLPMFLTQAVWAELPSLGDEPALQRLVHGLRGSRAETATVQAPAALSGEPPYRGLLVFETEHAGLFFGRAARTDWLLQALRPARDGAPATRFLAIVGASGSGKSSLARAGLLAALHDGRLADSQHWPQLLLKPGAQPLNSLVVALTAGLKLPRSPVDLQAELAAHPNALHLACRQALYGQPVERRVVLLVDQFEETFSLCSDETQRRAFIDNLLGAATAADGQVLLLLTLRDDFYGKCAPYPRLAAAIAESQCLLGPMNATELREAIEQPALRCGGSVEPGLTELLLRDAAGQAGSLPLLEHALRRLWEISPDRRLRLADYQAMNGLAGALQQWAEACYEGFSPQQQEQCRFILMRLVQPGAGTADSRRRAPLAEFAEQPQAAAVLHALVQARLITTQAEHGATPTGGEAHAEVAHEALIRGWNRLREWVEQDREALRLQHALAQGARDWQQNGRGEDWLLAGARLQAAEEWLAGHSSAASALECAFIQAGLERRDWQRQEREAQQQRELEQERKNAELARRLTRLALAGLLIAGCLAGWGWYEQQQRTTSLFDSLLTHAALLARGQDYAAAEAKLQASRKLDSEIPAARRHARNLLAGFTRLLGGAPEFTYPAAGAALTGSVALSPDGRWLAAAGERGTLLLYNRAGGQLVQPLKGHDVAADDVWAAVFHPSQPWLYSAGEDGQIIRWALSKDGQSATELQRWSADSQVWALALTPDGATLASGHSDGKIRVWRAADGTLLKTLEGHNLAIANFGLAFSPDGTRLVSAGYDETVRLWDWAKGESQTLSGVAGNFTGVAFAADGNTLAASQGNSIFAWEARSGRRLGELKGHQNRVYGLQFLPDGRLASASEDTTIRLWDVASGVTLRVLQGHSAGVASLALYRDGGGARLYSAGKDGTPRRWNLDLPGQWPLQLPGEPASAAIAPDGKSVLVGMADGGLRGYALPGEGEAAPRLAWETAAAHQGDVQRLAFDAEGRRLASAGFKDKLVKLWQIKPDGLASLQTFTGHSDSVHAVAFSPDGRRLASAGFDGQIGLFELEQPGQHLFPAHEGKIASVAFSPDSRQLLSAGQDMALKLWDLAQLPPTAPQLLAQAQDQLMWASLSPDGRRLAAVGREAVVSVQPLDAGAAALKLAGHEQAVFKALFSPDGQQLATVSGDMTVRLWDLAASPAAELLRLRLPTEMPASGGSPLWDFDFRCTPSGCWIAVPLVSGRLALYNLGALD